MFVCTPWKRVSWTLHSLLTSALDGSEWSISRLTHPPYPWGKALPIIQEAAWTPEAVWTFWRKVNTRAMFRHFEACFRNCCKYRGLQVKHSYLLVHRKCQPYCHCSGGVYCTASQTAVANCIAFTDLLDFRSLEPEILNWRFLLLFLQILNIVKLFEIASLRCVKDRHSRQGFWLLDIPYNTKSVFSGKRAVLKRQSQTSISISAEINDTAATSRVLKLICRLQTLSWWCMFLLCSASS